MSDQRIPVGTYEQPGDVPSGRRRRCLAALVAAASIGTVSVLGVSSADAQSTAPSSITPPTLRPPATAPTPPAIAAPAPTIAAPDNAEQLSVTPSAIVVEGAFPAVSAQVAALVAPYAGRTVTLAQIYAVASEVEAIHIRGGYIFARATIPPQTLRAGAPVRIVIVNGYLEAADVSGLPRRVRRPVAARVAALIGRHQLKLSDLEPPLVLAAETPGIRLTSTLARGEKLGGARLLLSGRQSPISGSLVIDNGLAASLGRYGVTGQLALNSVLGFGEQFYGFLSTGYDPGRVFTSEAPVTVAGGGVTVPSASGRFFLNPEVTFARTRPLPTDGVPITEGRLRRLTLRGGYAVLRTRRTSLTVAATIEQVRESNDAVDFGVRLSLDRFLAGRLRVNYSHGWLGGGGLSAQVQLSHGLGGIDATRNDPTDSDAISSSRQGAQPFFTRLDAGVRVLKPVFGGFVVTANGRAQTSFGDPLFRSEQSALEGPDALSAYVGGITAVDESVTGRIEVTHALPLTGLLRGLGLEPYVFAAAGHGWLDRPTALERAQLSLEASGAGLRGNVAGTGLGFAVEYAHGFSRFAEFDRVDRVSASISLVF